jgi:hypothetical protein
MPELQNVEGKNSRQTLMGRPLIHTTSPPPLRRGGAGRVLCGVGVELKITPNFSFAMKQDRFWSLLFAKLSVCEQINAASVRGNGHHRIPTPKPNLPPSSTSQHGESTDGGERNSQQILPATGLRSVDRNNKATLPLTRPGRTNKSYAKDLSPRIVKLPYVS